MASNENLFIKPIEKVVNSIKDSQKNVLLVGDRGTGKSTVLNHYLNGQSDIKNPIFDGTVETFERFPDIDLFCLLQVCLLLSKLILTIKKNNEYLCFLRLEFFETKIRNIIGEIYTIYAIQDFGNKSKSISKELSENPEVLIDEFLDIASSTFDYETITLILDNFDVVGESSKLYQQYMYSVLPKYFKVVFSVSDVGILKEKKRLAGLKKDNDIVKVDYSLDVETLKQIIDNVINHELRLADNHKITVFTSFLISDEEFEIMIKKSHGNLYRIFNAIRCMYIHFNDIKIGDYGRFAINYISLNNEQDKIVMGYTERIRKLFI